MSATALRFRLTDDALVSRVPHSVSGTTIEDALSISPPHESVLFANRDKFDLVAIYDDASESMGDEHSPVSILFKAIYEMAFRKFLKNMPMLLIGGFTIASALSKTAIDRVLITRVLSLAGERPSTVLLAFMGVACFASMWISNVAAPTLCFTLIQVRSPRPGGFGSGLVPDKPPVRHQNLNRDTLVLTKPPSSLRSRNPAHPPDASAEVELRAVPDRKCLSS